MPHDRPVARVLWRLAPLVAVVLLSCGRDGSRSDAASIVIVVRDSTARDGSLEALALPVDPASLRLAPPSRAGDERQRLADSAAALDARFQSSRDALNDRARAMYGQDVRTREYASRWDAFRRDELTADALRRERDRVRMRLRRAGGDVAAGGGPPRDSILARARDGGRTPVHAPLRGGSVTLSLAPGAWWIGIGPAGAVPVRFEVHQARPGTSDTVRLDR